MEKGNFTLNTNCAVGAAAVIAVGAIVIVKKKKKTAV